MAQTNLQRQTAFRQRHSASKTRIVALVNNETKANLSRLARHYGTTESRLLENLIEIAIHKARMHNE